MQYLGGKSRIAKPISEIINNELSKGKPKHFVSLFCGSCAVEAQVVGAKSKILNDSHPYLMAMWQKLNNRLWEIPDSISKEQYEYIKNNKDENKALTGFTGFACSFGGKWFGGYAHLKNYEDKNYAKYSKNSLLRKMKTLQGSSFLCMDYRDVFIPDRSVVYCDPPYKNTTKYSNSSIFNHEEFWEYIRKISKYSKVFISEYVAPSDFVEIWSKPQTTKLDARVKENIFVSMDKLFTPSRT